MPKTDGVPFPDQPLVMYTRGPFPHLRFQPNPIVQFLLDAGPNDLNVLAMMDFPDDARTQFAQLIGYSLSGYGELSYVSDEAYARAKATADTLRPTTEERTMFRVDGGPAYPIWTPDMPVEGAPGLSKLEVASLAAMQGDWGNSNGVFGNSTTDEFLEARARTYYRMARAWIEAGEEAVK